MKLNGHSEIGFTLIELLVVIAVIAILAAILLPVLSLAGDYARTAGCKNHLHQTGLAIQMYVHDDQDQYPRYLGPGGPANGDIRGKGGRATGLTYWSTKLLPYYSINWTNRAFHCPGYSGMISGPYEPGAVDRRGGYGYNLRGAWTTVATKASQNFGLGAISYWGNAPVYQAEIRVPSEMLAIGDTYMKVGDTSGDDCWGCGPLASGYAALPFAQRHGKNYNVLLCDGHVSNMNPWILFDPTNTASMWNYDHQPHPELW